MNWYEKYAKYHGYDINRDVEKQIVEVLTFNQKNFGKLYCPQKSHSDSNICPCEEFRNTNKCACNFFVNK